MAKDEYTYVRFKGVSHVLLGPILVPYSEPLCGTWLYEGVVVEEVPGEQRCQVCKELESARRAYAPELAGMSDGELFHVFLENQQPDDYDGEFTRNGAMEKSLSQIELVRRLRECGFLEEGE